MPWPWPQAMRQPPRLTPESATTAPLSRSSHGQTLFWSRSPYRLRATRILAFIHRMLAELYASASVARDDRGNMRAVSRLASPTREFDPALSSRGRDTGLAFRNSHSYEVDRRRKRPRITT
jgi:hypothetical protein